MSTAPAILIVTCRKDQTADLVMGKLQRRGLAIHRFDPADFPSRATLSQSFDSPGSGSMRLQVDGTTLDLLQLRSAWFRRPGAPTPHADVCDPELRAYLAAECAQRLDDAWSSLTCSCVPAIPTVIARASLKAAQLGIAQELGFEIAPTLFTHDPQAALEFHRRHEGRIVSKLAGPAFNDRFLQRWVRYTEPVSARDLCAFESLRFGPVVLQAWVPKRIELRVTVVGDHVFTAEIHSQDRARTRVDWRRYDLARTPHRIHDLPKAVAQRCIALTRRLGLRYGAIDLVLTPDGRTVFLEINPNGQFHWIEQLTGLAISEALADLLAGEDCNDGSPRRDAGEGAFA